MRNYISSALFLLCLFCLVFFPSKVAAQTAQTARNVGLGVAVQDIHLEDQEFADALSNAPITYLTSESGMYIHQVWTGRDEYNFTKLDAMVNYAEEHNFHMVGHTLVVYKMVPEWFRNEVTTREEAIELLRGYVQTMAERYKGKVKTWHVVNEAVQTDSGAMVDGIYRADDIWLNLIGPEYVGLVFEWVDEVDPDANLYYTDFSEDLSSPKVDRILTLVENLKNDGVPIDGVGLQGHQCIDDPLETGCENKKPSYEQYKYFFDGIEALGLKSAITEMDVRIGNSTDQSLLEEQAVVYENAFRACLDTPGCERFATWGFSDKYTWIDRRKAGDDDGPQRPLLFDETFQPKLAFERILALKHPVLGDFDTNQSVDLFDFGYFIDTLGETGYRGFSLADFNFDGYVDLLDYSFFLGYLGSGF